MKMSDEEEDSLAFWKMNLERFPPFANLALRFLCITATKVPTGDLFRVL